MMGAKRHLHTLVVQPRYRFSSLGAMFPVENSTSAALHSLPLLALVGCSASQALPPPGSPQRPSIDAAHLSLAFPSGVPESDGAARAIPSSGEAVDEAPPLLAWVDREAPGPTSRGRPIDLDVHDADIREVCRLLADVGRVNLVVAEGVTGTVTVQLRHVPWDEALDALLAAKGLIMRRQGTVVIVSKP
jgi:hypothetical protein